MGGRALIPGKWEMVGVYVRLEGVVNALGEGCLLLRVIMGFCLMYGGC